MQYPSLPTLKRKLGIRCPMACSLHPDKIGWDHANALMSFRALGNGAPVFGREALRLTGKVYPTSSISRHFHHYVEAFDQFDAPENTPKPSDIEILDSIIGAGFRNARNWKPTIRDTLEAMKLKTSMTGNSAFDDLIQLFDVDDEPDVAEESAEARLSEEERPDDHSEDLEVAE